MSWGAAHLEDGAIDLAHLLVPEVAAFCSYHQHVSGQPCWPGACAARLIRSYYGQITGAQALCACSNEHFDRVPLVSPGIWRTRHTQRGLKPYTTTCADRVLSDQPRGNQPSETRWRTCAQDVSRTVATASSTQAQVDAILESMP